MNSDKSDDDSDKSDEEMDDNVTRIVKDGLHLGSAANRQGHGAARKHDPEDTRPQYRTPRAVNLDIGLPAGNPDSVDEMYSNVALLLFLLAATLEASTYLGAVNWLPTRLIFMKIWLAMSWIRLMYSGLG
ncbi:hypothetical protein BM221_000130 [Beauveria bassiana]|uniref:Uncharacterized protein n=1 Tax=Beauveria bassiana TaxID=176275 RepID=A0A2N6NZL0_BEABA|nr:hypothetical protein BM221_000130 [Beauveria bassiana]